MTVYKYLHREKKAGICRFCNLAGGKKHKRMAGSKSQMKSKWKLITCVVKKNKKQWVRYFGTNPKENGGFCILGAMK